MANPKRNKAIAYIAENSLYWDVGYACGISRQAVAQWQEVPWNRVLKVERVTGIPRHEIRPDIYPAPALAAKKRRSSGAR